MAVRSVRVGLVLHAYGKHALTQIHSFESHVVRYTLHKYLDF